MSKLYCYVCQGAVKRGRRVAFDPILSFALSVKKRLGISKSEGKTLVVCPKCMDEYNLMRSRFLGKIRFLGAIALIVFIVQAYIVSILAGLVFAAFILVFVIPYYAPSLEKES